MTRESCVFILLASKDESHTYMIEQSTLILQPI